MFVGALADSLVLLLTSIAKIDGHFRSMVANTIRDKDDSSLDFRRLGVASETVCHVSN